MNIVDRNIESFVRKVSREYPVITIVGPRQSGKTTLAKKMFPKLPYYSFENPDLTAEIKEDPKGFLNSLTRGAVLDEFQRIPEITSYLQQIVDNNPSTGMYILTGSRSLEIMDKVSQSLAGRSATVELLPFSYQELENSILKQSYTELIYNGFYPPIYHRKLTPSIWFSNYVRNYLERDVRQLINVKDLSRFQKFLTLSAGRIGQLINYSDISSELGLSHNTIKSWFSVLEASYIVYFLQPYHSNFSKRFVKTPKLYFYDTGLVSWLLSIREPAHIDTHPLKGALFENYCVSELIKNRYNRGQRSNLYFWRDKSGHEVDVIIDEGTQYSGIEIKSSQTYNKIFLKNLNYLSERDIKLKKKYVLWGSEDSAKTTTHERISWRELRNV